MFNATHGQSRADGDGRQAAHSATRRTLRSRLARTALMMVPVAGLSASLGSTTALAAASQPGKPMTVTAVTWHKLTLLHGWKSSQSTWNTGNPSYAISGGVVYLSGSLHGGAVGSDLAILPKSARPARWLYLTVDTYNGSHGTLLIKSDGEMSVYSSPATNATTFSSLAAVSYPTAATSQHKLNLMNGWTSAQAPYGTGDPSYVVRNGIVYLSGSLKGGTSADFGILPASARPAHIIYRGTYTFQGAFGEAYFEPTGFAGAGLTSAGQEYTSLAGISFPVATVSQHKVTLLNGWKSGQTPFGTGTFSYAIKGGIVYLSGGIKQPSGSNGLVAVLPKAARPTHNLWITVYTSSATVGTLHIRPNGQVIVGSAADPSAARTITSLGAISYPHNS
jgi:hypothetical protein